MSEITINPKYIHQIQEWLSDRLKIELARWLTRMNEYHEGHKGTYLHKVMEKLNKVSKVILIMIVVD